MRQIIPDPGPGGATLFLSSALIHSGRRRRQKGREGGEGGRSARRRRRSRRGWRRRGRRGRGGRGGGGAAGAGAGASAGLSAHRLSPPVVVVLLLRSQSTIVSRRLFVVVLLLRSQSFIVSHRLFVVVWLLLRSRVSQPHDHDRHDCMRLFVYTLRRGVLVGWLIGFIIIDQGVERTRQQSQNVYKNRDSCLVVLVDLFAGVCLHTQTQSASTAYQ